MPDAPNRVALRSAPPRVPRPLWQPLSCLYRLTPAGPTRSPPAPSTSSQTAGAEVTAAARDHAGCIEAAASSAGMGAVTPSRRQPAGRQTAAAPLHHARGVSAQGHSQALAPVAPPRRAQSASRARHQGSTSSPSRIASPFSRRNSHSLPGHSSGCGTSCANRFMVRRSHCRLGDLCHGIHPTWMRSISIGSPRKLLMCPTTPARCVGCSRPAASCASVGVRRRRGRV